MQAQSSSPRYRWFIPVFLVATIIFGTQSPSFARIEPHAGASASDTPGDTARSLAPAAESGTLTLTVIDRSADDPLQLVRIALQRNGRTVSGAMTNATGNAVIPNLKPGWYTITTTHIGYQPYSDSIYIAGTRTTDTIRLEEVVGQTVVVTAVQAPRSVTEVDLRSGNQVLGGQDAHAAPSERMTGIIQQNLTGASRAPTGEVHVRGQHGELSYYIDGIPVPLGIFGGLNEVVDPAIIDHATFLTGGFPAEYGGQMAAIVDIQTKVPNGRFHAESSTYAGTYATSAAPVGPARINANGQRLAVSGRDGDLGIYLSGARQESDRRIDQPTPTLFHDHGFDYFLFGKAQYIIGPGDYLSANLNYGVTQTQVPYDSAEGIAEDIQRTSNSFQTLSWFHTFSDDAGRESGLFAGAYAREGSLRFTPSVADQPRQQLSEDTAGYVVGQWRSYVSYGLRSKYFARIIPSLGIAGGLNVAATLGRNEFTFLSETKAGPITGGDFGGSDIGVFLQTDWFPTAWSRVEAGMRWDRQTAPDIGPQSDFSPRLKLSLLPDDQSTIYLYYGRMFMPANIEGLRAVAQAIGDSSAATFPERDEMVEGALMRSWDFGLTGKLAAFYKRATPGLDDETLGSSAIKVTVNIEQVRVTGLEMSLAFSQPDVPLSGYVNASLIHAYGRGRVSGGFLPADTSITPFDLDHDQRLAASIGLTYSGTGWFADVSALYGSGLTNGRDDVPYGTGLLDLNQDAHTTPAWIMNLGLGAAVDLGGGQTLEPSVFVTNLFDHQHLLKGAFFSGASFEEPRNVMVRVAWRM